MPTGPFAAKRHEMRDEFFAKLFLLGGWLGGTDTDKRTRPITTHRPHGGWPHDPDEPSTSYPRHYETFNGPARRRTADELVGTSPRATDMV